MITKYPTILEADIGLVEPIQRLLLTADGTLTSMLEAVNLEKICLVLLDQKTGPAERSLNLLDLSAGEPLLTRRVLLKGERTGDTYVYAESSIAVERLEERIRQELSNSHTPLGKLWKKYRTETFKEILHSGMEIGGELSFYFEVSPEEPLLVRRCRVSSGGRPIALITEYVRCTVT